jgi:hypothetical protein
MGMMWSSVISCVEPHEIHAEEYNFANSFLPIWKMPFRIFLVLRFDVYEQTSSLFLFLQEIQDFLNLSGLFFLHFRSRFAHLVLLVFCHCFAEINEHCLQYERKPSAFLFFGAL